MTVARERARRPWLPAAVLPAVLFAAALSLPRGAAADEAFDVRLSAAPRDASMRNAVAGAGAARVTLRGHSLTITGTFDGFTTPATNVELRQGATVAVRGPAIHALTLTKSANGTSGSFAGTVTLSDAELAGLNVGTIYVQIASASAPDGNVWGWLLPSGVKIVRDR